MPDTDPILPSEIVLRRVPKQHMTIDGKVSPSAFSPTERDKNGISVYRVSHHSPDEVGTVLRSSGSQPTWVVELCVEDLAELGIQVLADGLAEKDHPKGVPQPGHALLPQICYMDAKTSDTISRKAKLANLANKRTIHGPYSPPSAGN